MKIKFLLPVIILSSAILGCSDELKLDCKTFQSCIESDKKIKNQLDKEESIQYLLAKILYQDIKAIEQFNNNPTAKNLQILLAFSDSLLANKDWDNNLRYVGYDEEIDYSDFEVTIEDVNNYILQIMDKQSYESLKEYVINNKNLREQWRIYKDSLLDIMYGIRSKKIQIDTCFEQEGLANFSEICTNAKALNSGKYDDNDEYSSFKQKLKYINNDKWISRKIIEGTVNINNIQICLSTSIRKMGKRIEWSPVSIKICDAK